MNALTRARESKYSEITLVAALVLIVGLVAFLTHQDGWRVPVAMFLGMVLILTLQFVGSGQVLPKFRFLVAGVFVSFWRFWARLFHSWKALPWEWPEAPIEQTEAETYYGSNLQAKTPEGEHELCNSLLKDHQLEIRRLRESNDFLRRKITEGDAGETLIFESSVGAHDAEPKSHGVFDEDRKGSAVLGNDVAVVDEAPGIVEKAPLSAAGSGSSPADPQIFDESEVGPVEKAMQTSHPMPLPPGLFTYDGEVGFHDPDMRWRVSRGHHDDTDRILVNVTYSWQEPAVVDILNNLDEMGEGVDLTDKTEIMEAVRGATTMWGLHASRFWINSDA